MSEQNNDTISFDLPKNQSSVIKVIGVGGGGSNAVNHMYGHGIRGVDFVVCNTDSQALSNSQVPNKIQLGVTLTEGLGAGANPEIGQQAALENIEEIKSLLETNTKMVFITAGMGGGTGTGAAPVIAKAAKDLGILTVGICTIPFLFEGNTRKQQAEKGVEQLRSSVDSLVVINNNKLREVYGNLGFKAGFAKADEVLATAARGIAEVITHHYTTNIDLRDAKTVLADSGTAIMGSAVASGEDRARMAISQALDSPLLNDNHIRGAKNVLLLIVSGREEITIDEIGEINDHIQNEAGGSANIIMGIGEDEELGDDIGVTIIATGFAPDQQVQVIGRAPQKVVHTLEDEQPVSQAVFDKPLSKDEEESSDDMISAELARLSKKAPSPSQPNLFEFDEDREEPQEPQAPQVQGPEAPIRHELPEEKPEQQAEPTENFEEPEEEAPAEVPVTFESEENEEPVEEAEGPVFEIDPPVEEEESTRHVFSLEDEDDTPEEKPVDTPREMPAPEQPRCEKPEQEQPRSEEKPQPVKREEKEEKKTIRYTLEDYTELENQLRSAKPQHKSSPKQVEVQKQEPEDDSLKFEVRKVDDKSKGSGSRGGDPMESTIEESMKMRAEERRAKFKAFNYRFKNHPFTSVDEADNEPAYKRQGVQIEDTRYSSENRSGRFTIEDSEHGTDIKTNNSFLHDNVD